MRFSTTPQDFNSVFGTIEATKLIFEWFAVPQKVCNIYQHYHPNEEPNEEITELEEKDRCITKKLNIYEKDLHKRDEVEYRRRWKSYQKEANKLWTDFGAATLSAEKELFVAFLKQNKFTTKEIASARKSYNASIRQHRKEKRGKYSFESACKFSGSKLQKAYDTFVFYTGWDITTKKGNILVHSAGENSIPYELFGPIESYLNAARYHLG